MTYIPKWRVAKNGKVRFRENGFVAFRLEGETLLFLDKLARDENGKRCSVERPMEVDDLQRLVYGEQDVTPIL